MTTNKSVLFRSRDNTPAPLLNMDKEHEEQMINNFRSEMEAKIREKEREQQEEKKERIKEKKAEEGELSTESLAATETAETEPTPGVKEMLGGGDIKVEVHATAVHHDQVLEPRLSHAMSHEISHSQAVSQNTQQSQVTFTTRTGENWRRQNYSNFLNL